MVIASVPGRSGVTVSTAPVRTLISTGRLTRKDLCPVVSARLIGDMVGADVLPRCSAVSWLTRASCAGDKLWVAMNLSRRLTRIPSLTIPPSSSWEGAGTLAWWRATTSH
jgi:hypothetical protein